MDASNDLSLRAADGTEPDVGDATRIADIVF